MKKTYAILTYVVCGLVAIQSASMVWAQSGLFLWIDGGGVVDKAALESADSISFEGAIGFMIHGINGMMLIPVVALALLVVSFFAKIPRGVAWAVAVAVLVALQVALGILGHEFAISGLLHGINAMALFTVALLAGLRVGRAATPAPVLA